jgi:RNA polymerase sigma factor FliA
MKNAESLIVNNLPLAIRLAHRFVNAQPIHIDDNDAVSEASMALVNAAQRFRYRPGKQSAGAAFWKFANWRVRGSLRDMLRKESPLVGGRRASRFQLCNVSLEVFREGESGREGWEDYAGTQAMPPCLLCDPLVPPNDAVTASVSGLPPRLRMVLLLYYREGLRFHEIGRRLGVNESRASQLHTDAIGRLRVALQARGIRKVSDVL